MIVPSCHLKTDLSRVRLLANGAGAEWTPGPTDASTSAAPAPVESLRARAAQAADWIASTLKSKTRLGLVSIDVDECMCVWLRAISGEEPVLAATLRGSAQDWGDRFTGGAVQRLLDPEESASTTEKPSRRGLGAIVKSWQRPIGKSPAQRPTAAALLSCPASLVRLWLDELDARGVRAEMVSTLWHSAAQAWATGAHEGVTAVILLDNAERAVWSWSRGPDLLAAGAVSFERAAENPAPTETPSVAPAERAATRLGLDWLTWATQLGLTPSRIIVVGEGAAPFVSALRTRWPETPTDTRVSADPVGETVSRAASAAGPASLRSPRRCLLPLTHRPTRAVRVQYRWAAAALVLIAAGVAGLGARFTQARVAMAADAGVVQGESEGLANSLNEPSLKGSRNPVMALQSKLVELRKREPPKLPPAPKPIFKEMQRLAEILAKFEGVRIVQVSLDIKQASMIQLQVPSRRVGEEIKLALQSDQASIAWSEAGGSGSETQLRLNGNWIK